MQQAGLRGVPVFAHPALAPGCLPRAHGVSRLLAVEATQASVHRCARAAGQESSIDAPPSGLGQCTGLTQTRNWLRSSLGLGPGDPRPHHHSACMQTPVLRLMPTNTEPSWTQPIGPGTVAMVPQQRAGIHGALALPPSFHPSSRPTGSCHFSHCSTRGRAQSFMP